MERTYRWALAAAAALVIAGCGPEARPQAPAGPSGMDTDTQAPGGSSAQSPGNGSDSTTSPTAPQDGSPATPPEAPPSSVDAGETQPGTPPQPPGEVADAGTSTSPGTPPVEPPPVEPPIVVADAGTPAPAADAGQSSSSDAGTATASVDRFGIRELYPTVAGGREWFLPATADANDSEWHPEAGSVTKVSTGVFRTAGSGGQVRMSIVSPSGKAWWRNVEMTGYVRYVGDQPLNGQQRHWEWFARGERHTDNPVDAKTINVGVAAPAGTVTWPWYPRTGSIDAHCLGTAYHGNFYALTGRALFEKEVSHTGGYAGQVATKYAAFANPLNRWVGIKYVLRNDVAVSRVHMELWLDVDANGAWTKVTENDDTGAWGTSGGTLDGCSSSPYNYRSNMLMTWASPWVTFRSDAMTMEFKQLSVREIAPVP